MPSKASGKRSPTGRGRCAGSGPFLEIGKREGLLARLRQYNKRPAHSRCVGFFLQAVRFSG